MKSVMIRGFASLDNYGSGMMGLITIDRLRKAVGPDVRFVSDFFEDTSLDEIRAELGSEDVPLARLGKAPVLQRRELLQLPFTPSKARGHDMVVMLGGDDLSEYYDKAIWRHIAHLWHLSQDAPVVLLGQTIGPFARRPNRLAARMLFPAMHIFPRDRWCTDYLKAELGLERRVYQSTDLAYADLPLQHRLDIRDQVLRHYGLGPDGYATLIVSGLGSKYYTPDLDLFYDRNAEMAAAILARPDMAGRRLCMLAHTHGSYYGDEAANIRAVHARLAPDVANRVVLVTERVLQTRARFILGHGLFTVTGRMHPAVSTFQMGKPAISLAYSKKYEGVIGTMLGRSDLIIDANDTALWRDGAIVGLVMDRVDYVMANHERLTAEIRASIAEQKRTVDATFARIADLIGNGRGR